MTEMFQGSSTTSRRLLTGPEIDGLLARKRRKPGKRDRQTPAEWARDNGRAGAVVEWSIYAGSIRLWWAHAQGDTTREGTVLSIARDWWYEKGGAISKLAGSELDWERAVARRLLEEMNPLLGNWDGIVWREGAMPCRWDEGRHVVEPTNAIPIRTEDPPPHGTHVRQALGCDCYPCRAAGGAARQLKREAGRPKAKATS